MKDKRASYTAQIMALYRAMETRRPEGHRLFTDIYASGFLEGRLRLAAWLAGYPKGERWLYRYMQRRIPGALASGLARTRFIDDLLERHLQKGIRQVIILGSGFDTRALRLPVLHGVQVVEIDHPDTSRRKRALLQQTALPDNLRFLQADFNRQRLEDLFGEEHVDTTLPTVMIWEGVTNYLQREAVAEVMRLMGRFPKGSAIIFTYIHQNVLDEPGSWFGAARLISDLEKIEEKWTCGFLPETLPAWIQSFGLQLVDDKSAAQYREEYIPERTVLLKGYEFYRVAVAEVC